MKAAEVEKNPKIIHRIYFTNFAPFRDPFEHYLETWHKQLPDYKVMHWNMSNLDVYANEWTRKAFEQNAPVFLAEYFRWKLLYDFGGLYLDADCEILNGPVLHEIIEELYSQTEYDTFFGVEERSNGYPTAQTCGAKKGSELALYMMTMYEERLAHLWPWREKRGLIGPQLMSLYFLGKNVNVDTEGFFTDLDEPRVSCRAKVYPQTYFSPKFSILGETLDFQEGKTCIYHLFANSNVDFAERRKEDAARTRALTFAEYRGELRKRSAFPRYYHSSHLSTKSGEHMVEGLKSVEPDGLLCFGPYVTMPVGAYIAQVVLKEIPTRGRTSFSITSESGKSVLASTDVSWEAGATKEFTVAFSVWEHEARNMEFVLETRGIDSICVDGIRIEQQRASVVSRPTAKNLKLLHRVYFGFDGKPDVFAKYLETWREQLPDFQIMKWDATNLPMDINPYVRKLYKERDHAFLTDFFRWYLLREFGGTYLDADVELVDGNTYRNIVEELDASMTFDAFIGIDERSGGWYTAHSMASKPGSELSRFMCDVYANFGSFAAWRKKGLYFWAPQLVALYFANMGHNVDGMGTSPNLDGPVVKSRVKIYPQDWFSPLAPTGDPKAPFKLNGYSENTALCHHFACSWHDAGSMYLEHAKTRGGQTSVLLRDLLLQARNKSFPATEDAVCTQVGTKVDQLMLTQGRAGYLAYGPYISVLPGDYRVTFSLSDIECIDDVQLDVCANFGQDVLAAKKVLPPDLCDGAVSLLFTAGKPVDGVEFRLQVGTASKFGLSAISLASV
jgi:mannosyltransferase OCH1-like enzyme